MRPGQACQPLRSPRSRVTLGLAAGGPGGTGILGGEAGRRGCLWPLEATINVTENDTEQGV